jgi:hypothetical protein
LVTLAVVLAAVYGLASSLLSVAVAAAWYLGLRRMRASANELLAIRLIPACGAALFALTVVLPAFLVSEPSREVEQAGPLLVALALVALVCVGIGIGRVSRASSTARAILGLCDPVAHHELLLGRSVDVIDMPEPIVAVVGGFRPRIIASTRVISACSDDEFQQVVAHEAAHVSARDNIKLWLLFLSPDVLAWLPPGRGLAARWRAAAEREADERATGHDRSKRVALAAAIIKVARLSTPTANPAASLCMQIAVDDVAGRVRGLLAPPTPVRRSRRLRGLAAAALLVPALGMPFYGTVQQFIETLVAFGR